MKTSIPLRCSPVLGALLSIVLSCQSALAADPALWMNFDDGLFRDSSVGQRSTVFPVGMVTSNDVPPGFSGGQSLDLRFPIPSHIILIGSVADPEGFSLSYWLKPEGILTPGGRQEITHGNVSGFQTAIERPADGPADQVQLAFGISDRRISSDATIPVGEWSHVLWRVQPDTTDLFVMGELAFTGQGLGTPLTGAELFDIAPSINGLEPYSGRLDEIHFYDSLLDEAEILTLLNQDQLKPSVIRAIVEGVSTISITIKDGTGAAVKESEIHLEIDGEPVQPTITRDGNLVTLTHRPGAGNGGRRNFEVSITAPDSVGGTFSWEGTASPTVKGRIIDPSDPPPIEFPPDVDLPGGPAEGAWSLRLIGVPNLFPFELDQALEIALDPEGFPLLEFESTVLNHTTPSPQFPNYDDGFFLFGRELFPEFTDLFPPDHVLVAHSEVEHRGGSLTFSINTIGTFFIRLRKADDGSSVPFSGATDDVEWDSAKPELAGRYFLSDQIAGLFVEDLAPGRYEIEFFGTSTGPLLGFMGKIYHELSVTAGIVTMEEAGRQAQLIGDPTGPLPHATGSRPQVLELTSIERDRDTGHITLTWPSQVGVFYIVQRSTDLNDFEELSDGEAGVDGPASFTDRHAPAGSAFYRIAERP